MSKVIDTNVPLVVKLPAGRPQDLINACEEILEHILEGKVPVVTDEAGEIVNEYLNQLCRSGQPSLGDEFVKYVVNHQYGWDAAMRPDIEPVAENSYTVLGGDDDIDPSDRKMVAAAKVAGVPVVQATDTKWLGWSAVLGRHGVRVEYAHEPSIRAAYLKKFKREAP